MDVATVAETLGLQAHPEGGRYVETWRGPVGSDGRATGTAILYLLADGERSQWHRVDADELWIHNAGDGMVVSIERDGSIDDVVVGSDLDAGERPQVLVPAGAWQSARPAGSWALISCVVVPGFEFDGFELAPDGWSPDVGGDAP